MAALMLSVHDDYLIMNILKRKLYVDWSRNCLQQIKMSLASVWLCMNVRLIRIICVGCDKRKQCQSAVTI